MDKGLHPEKWVTHYADDLLRYAMFKINDVAVCEDLIQDTFLSALKAKESFKGNSHEKTWLTSILKNKIIDYYRKQGLYRSVSIQEGEAEHELNEDFFVQGAGWKPEQYPGKWEVPSDNQLMQKEFVQILKRCISLLNPIQSDILHEKYIVEKNSDSICKELNISKSNYWVIVHRIHATLRKCIETKWNQ